MSEDAVIHLALSPKAAEDLAQLCFLANATMDGCPLDYFDDPDITLSIFKAIQEDIKDGLAMQGQKPQKRERPTGPGRRVKKGTRKK